jgi:hypothetical protein
MNGTWTPAELNSYLTFGTVYRPPGRVPFPFLPELDTVAQRRRLEGASAEQLEREGVRILKATFHRAAEAVGSCQRDVAIGISGGLDSRAILAGMLDHLAPAEITSYTYGVPGASDFQIGALVARRAGVRHEAVRTDRLGWTSEDLVNCVEDHGVPMPMMLGGKYLNWYVRRRLGDGFCYLHGFLGGSLRGSLLPPQPSRTWREALDVHVRRLRLDGSHRLTPIEWSPDEVMPSEPLVPSEVLSFDDQLDLALRQRFRIQPHSTSASILTPLADSEWASFMLALPFEYRRPQQLLFGACLRRGWPRLFDLPTGTTRLPLTAGPVRRRLRHFRDRQEDRLRYRLPFLRDTSPRTVQHLNLVHGLRHDPGLRGVAEEYLHGLDGRGLFPWLDLGYLWTAHQRGEANHTRVLRVLVSLEANLRADEVGAVHVGRGGGGAHGG